MSVKKSNVDLVYYSYMCIYWDVEGNAWTIPMLNGKMTKNLLCYVLLAKARQLGASEASTPRSIL